MISILKNIFSKTASISTIDKQWSLDEMRKRSRILVVDDDPDAFPTHLLSNEGYNVTHWERIMSLKPLETAEYDIIVLDIHGICTDDTSANGGLGVLKHIKTYNPSQIVIAYSAKKYDFKQADFWRMADDFLGKPSSLLDCKKKIDELLQSKFSIDYYWRGIEKILRDKGIDNGNIQKIENYVVKNVSSNKHINADDLVSKLKIAKEIAVIIATISSVMLKLYQ